MKEKNWFRSSFLSIFDNTFKLTWIAVLAIITNFAIITKKISEFNLNININLLLIIFLLLFIFCVFIYNLVIWRISRFEIKDKIIVIYKNIFIKDKKEFLIDNIANISISKNIFERISKLTRIRIFENEKKKLFCNFDIVVNQKTFNKYILPFLKKNNINISKNANKHKIRFSIFDIFKHSFLSIPVSSIVVIINFILLIFTMIRSGTLLKELLYNFLGLIITLVGFILPVIYSILKNVIKYIFFEIKRENEYIVLSYGFFTKKEYIIPVSKINGVIIDVSFLSKIFGCYKLNIINSGIGDKKNELEMLFPISRKNKCRELIKIILPEYNIEMEHKRQPYEAIIIIGIKIMFVMLAIIIPLIYLDIKIAIYISLILLISILFFYFVKRTIISDKYICIINGIFVKRIRIINYNKIEKIEIKEGIISKKFGICKIYMYILAGIKNTRISSGYIKMKYTYKICGNVLK